MRTCILLLLIIVNPLLAQPASETLADSLKAKFQRDYLSIGFLLQFVADAQIERTADNHNGFNISTMRLILKGNLDGGFGYLLTTDFTDRLSLLDAQMSWKFPIGISLHGGQFKAPFSREFLVDAANIDMVNRSQVVSALAPGRQIGMQVSVASDLLFLDAGIFNGNGFDNNGNDNDNYMFAGRISGKFNVGKAALDVGLNGARSEDRAVQVASSRFRGTRTLWGIDGRIEGSDFFLAGEYIHSSLTTETSTTELEATDKSSQASNRGDETNPQGFHVTAGYKFPAYNQQVLLRMDQYHDDITEEPTTLFILGYNVSPAPLTGFQFNYIIDSDNSEFKYHQLLINAQVSF